MRIRIEKVGDSFGLILPGELMGACGFSSEATVAVQGNSLVVTPRPSRAREGWAEALRSIPQANLDRDFADLAALREAPDEWDADEWRWPSTS